MGNGQPLILSDAISPYTGRECAILTRFNSLHVRLSGRIPVPAALSACGPSPSGRWRPEVRRMRYLGCGTWGPWSSTPVPGHDRWRVTRASAAFGRGHREAVAALRAAT